MDGSNTQSTQVKVTCPVCENEITIDLNELEIGDIYECPVCGGTSELVNKDPVTLEPVIKNK